MQLSKFKVNSLLEKQVFAALSQLIADIKNPQEAEQVLRSLLTEAELTSVAKRLGVVYWLSKKRSYRNIKTNLKVSSATIAEMQLKSNQPGWKLAIAKLTADEWANVWEQRIKGIFKR